MEKNICIKLHVLLIFLTQGAMLNSLIQWQPGSFLSKTVKWLAHEKHDEAKFFIRKKNNKNKEKLNYWIKCSCKIASMHSFFCACIHIYNSPRTYVPRFADLPSNKTVRFEYPEMHNVYIYNIINDWKLSDN
jgi:hypothetical protein